MELQNEELPEKLHRKAPTFRNTPEKFGPLICVAENIPYRKQKNGPKSFD